MTPCAGHAMAVLVLDTLGIGTSRRLVVAEPAPTQGTGSYLEPVSSYCQPQP